MLFSTPILKLTENQIEFISTTLTVMYYKSIITGCLMLVFIGLFYWAADTYLVNLPERPAEEVGMFLPRLAFSSLIILIVTFMMSDILMWVFYPDTFLYGYMSDFDPYPGG